MPKILRVVILTGILLAGQRQGSARAAGQELEQQAQQLAGEKSRIWVFRRVEVGLGGSEECRSGEIWTFSADHELQIKTCEDKHWVTKNLNWSLSREGQIDTLVTIGEERYYLTFSQRHSATYMRLRNVRASQTDLRVDREFRLKGVE
jgi:hypothetical protein